MAGVKKFDERQVLEKALRVFWERGYEGTSIQDLVEATGLHRGSLYGAFGGKEQLFLEAMEHYAQLVAEPLLAALDHDDPRISLARFFETSIARLGDREIPSGCLNTNTAVAVPTCPVGIRQALNEQVDQMETAIYQALLRGQEKGYLAAGEDLRALARYIVCIAHGLAVMNRRGLGGAALNDVVETALATISTKVIR